MSPAPTRATLERAMIHGELELYYQPKVCLLRGSVIGAEALLRWNVSPEEVVSPDAFIPLAEKSGLLHDITVELIDRVVDTCSVLREVRAGLSLSMNVAPNDLASNTISRRIADCLASKRIRAHDLQIEITESAAMGNFEQIHDGLMTLKALGIKVLMDDFGTGYSSIDRLSQLPFASLKLDQGVVRRMGTSRQNLNVVKSSISMARELRMTSVAEGIESAGAYNFLIANGCEEGQGYFIGKPMKLTDFIEFVKTPHNFEGSQIGRVHQAIYNVLFDRRCLLDAAFCSKLDPSSVLPSVIDPGISETAAQSRSGVWYYGIGQRLRHLDSFVALEEPLERLREHARDFMQQLARGVDSKRLDQIIAAFDKEVDHSIRLLHAVERELLLTAGKSGRPARQ